MTPEPPNPAPEKRRPEDAKAPRSGITTGLVIAALLAALVIYLFLAP